MANSLALGTSPIVRSLVDPEGGMQAVRDLDNISFAKWFKSHGGSQGSIDRMWDPIGESKTTINYQFIMLLSPNQNCFGCQKTRSLCEKNCCCIEAAGVMSVHSR